MKKNLLASAMSTPMLCLFVFTPLILLIFAVGFLDVHLMYHELLDGGYAQLSWVKSETDTVSPGIVTGKQTSKALE